MPKIVADFKGQTIITTFEMTPATAHELMEKLQAAYDQFIRVQPGFLAAGLHMNDAMTRICNYSQWQRREDYQAMLRTPEMRARNKEIAALCKGFEPVMYEVVASF
ncbi:antibiotic biosynthesis monooxygenase family protein [Fuscibacter oryzae]|uniref:Antibiotic biosynthesis monooxygenase n=1 Tax=Fuscibacter oryzae TaxID=2803939 RepID=A0A8J7MRV4_9RHOB|nr:antibiotic biosynthesis monooxygenase [Fuscibacter oryzae]MBL4928492.1 antibiotic biosynthesis monooxygenase [Fuscibacter oryzae]